MYTDLITDALGNELYNDANRELGQVGGVNDAFLRVSNHFKYRSKFDIIQ